jgi:hypothetical protein
VGGEANREGSGVIEDRADGVDDNLSDHPQSPRRRTGGQRRFVPGVSRAVREVESIARPRGGAGEDEHLAVGSARAR